LTMRMIFIVCLFSLLDCKLAFPQVADKPVPAKPVPTNVGPQNTDADVTVFHLRNTKSSLAIETLKKIGPPCQFAEDPRRNAIFVRASKDALKEIAKLLETIDIEERSPETTEVVHTHAKNMEAGGAIVHQFAKMNGVEVAFDEGIFVVKGSKDGVTRVTEFINEIDKVTDRRSMENSKLRSYAFRVLWLSNDPVEDSRNVIEPDATLSKSIQKLGELGFANMKIKMQLLGRCDMIQGEGECQVDGSHLVGNTRRTLHVQANLAGAVSEPINGKLTLKAGVTEQIAKDSPTTNTNVQVAMYLEPKKYYILSASPIGGFQTAFVVQLIEDL
ncbi:MAG: secretin N-terminal domain-containing protein, partial [Pirellula sp.]